MKHIRYSLAALFAIGLVAGLCQLAVQAQPVKGPGDLKAKGSPTANLSAVKLSAKKGKLANTIELYGSVWNLDSKLYSGSRTVRISYKIPGKDWVHSNWMKVKDMQPTTSTYYSFIVGAGLNTIPDVTYRLQLSSGDNNPGDDVKETTGYPPYNAG